MCMDISWQADRDREEQALRHRREEAERTLQAANAAGKVYVCMYVCMYV
jgi:hypothetical protein